MEVVSKIHVSNALMFQNKEAIIQILHWVRAKSQMKFSMRMDTPYLAPVGNREYPGGASTLLHIPQEPESRDLMGLRGDTQVHKKGGQLLRRSAQEETRAKLANTGEHLLHSLGIYSSNKLTWQSGAQVRKLPKIVTRI